jgi:hypothetical protein
MVHFFSRKEISPFAATIIARFSETEAHHPLAEASE